MENSNRAFKRELTAIKGWWCGGRDSNPGRPTPADIPTTLSSGSALADPPPLTWLGHPRLGLSGRLRI